MNIGDMSRSLDMAASKGTPPSLLTRSHFCWRDTHLRFTRTDPDQPLRQNSTPKPFATIVATYSVRLSDKIYAQVYTKSVPLLDSVSLSYILEIASILHYARYGTWSQNCHGINNVDNAEILQQHWEIKAARFTCKLSASCLTMSSH